MSAMDIKKRLNALQEMTNNFSVKADKFAVTAKKTQSQLKERLHSMEAILNTVGLSTSPQLGQEAEQKRGIGSK